MKFQSDNTNRSMQEDAEEAIKLNKKCTIEGGDEVGIIVPPQTPPAVPAGEETEPPPAAAAAVAHRHLLIVRCLFHG